MRARRGVLKIDCCSIRGACAGALVMAAAGTTGWGAVPTASAADQGPVLLAQESQGNGIYPSGDPGSKYWTGSATYAKQSDGKEVWTFPDKSTTVKDNHTGKLEYRDPKGALVRRTEQSSNDFASYNTLEYWDKDGNWVVSTETRYRDGRYEVLTLVHSQGPGGPIKEGWSNVYNLENPGSFTHFGADGVIVSTSPNPSLVEMTSRRISKLKDELNAIPLNAPYRAGKEKELEDAQKRLSNYQLEIKKQREAQNAPSPTQNPPTQGTPQPTTPENKTRTSVEQSGPTLHYCDNPQGYYPQVASCSTPWREVSSGSNESPSGSGGPPSGAPATGTMPGFGLGGFGFGFSGSSFGGGSDDGPSDRGSRRPERRP